MKTGTEVEVVFFRNEELLDLIKNYQSGVRGRI